MSLSREKINHLSQILTKGLAELPGVIHGLKRAILELVDSRQ